MVIGRPVFGDVNRQRRQQVMQRMWQDAVSRGASAIVMMRFDTGEIAAQFSEVCCYGTAVVVVPIPEGEPGSTPQAAADARSRAQQAFGQATPGNPAAQQPYPPQSPYAPQP